MRLRRCNAANRPNATDLHSNHIQSPASCHRKPNVNIFSDCINKQETTNCITVALESCGSTFDATEHAVAAEYSQSTPNGI